MTVFGAIEAGGTKFVCGVGNAESGSLATATIPTRSPDQTFADVARFFGEAEAYGPLGGIGIATFGPADLNPASSTYGQILATPKPQWQGTDMLARVRAFTSAPLAIDTDVNAAALAEAGITNGEIRHIAYVTVGTGIGVGLVSNGTPVHGLGHPEAGHILPRRHPDHANFPGVCSFHADCMEGLASGPAIAAAWGATLSHLPENHRAWEVEADYLSQLCVTLFLTLAPERIVLGGGVMKQMRLFPMIHSRTSELLAGYFAGCRTAEDMATRILPPACVEPSGLVGAYMLAQDASR